MKQPAKEELTTYWRKRQSSATSVSLRRNIKLTSGNLLNILRSTTRMMTTIMTKKRRIQMQWTNIFLIKEILSEVTIIEQFKSILPQSFNPEQCHGFFNRSFNKAHALFAGNSVQNIFDCLEWNCSIILAWSRIPLFSDLILDVNFYKVYQFLTCIGLGRIWRNEKS